MLFLREALVPLCLCFLWIAVDPDKQAWHDKIAGTRAVRTRRVERATDWRGRATDDAPRPGFVAEHLGIRSAFGVGLPLVMLSMSVSSILREAPPPE